MHYWKSKVATKNAEEIEAKFRDLSRQQSITVALHPSVLAMVEEQVIGRNLSESEVRKLARDVASMPKKDLFIVKNG